MNSLPKKKRFSHYSKAEDEYIKKHYHNTLNSDLAIHLDRPESSISGRAFKLGVKKDKDFILKHSLKTAFKKGNIPVNKGVKMTPEVYEKARATMFKKGSKPHNYKPIGSERITKDGYIEVKINKSNKWRLKHRVVWEKHNPKLKNNEIVTFKDGNPLNTNIENLELKDRVKNMIENSIHKYPKEIIQSKVLICKIKKHLKNKSNG